MAFLTRALVVDDHPGIRLVLRAAADAASTPVEVVGEASNGHEAICAARVLQPNLVLLDIAMPVMDGLTALPEIQKAAPLAKIIILSAFEGEVLDLPDGVEYINKGGDLLGIFERIAA